MQMIFISLFVFESLLVALPIFALDKSLVFRFRNVIFFVVVETVISLSAYLANLSCEIHMSLVSFNLTVFASAALVARFSTVAFQHCLSESPAEAGSAGLNRSE